MTNETYRIGAFKKSWMALSNDLWLLSQLYLAHFIVWRELRRLHREGEAT